MGNKIRVLGLSALQEKGKYVFISFKNFKKLIILNQLNYYMFKVQELLNHLTIGLVHSLY